ncbi:MAG: hypothetical protein ACAI37_27120, partial [Chthoniobacter sp.]
LLVGIEALGLGKWLFSSDAHRGAWGMMSLFAPLYLGGILLAVRRPRSERFYEWIVEGMLFMPAIAVLIGG